MENVTEKDKKAVIEGTGKERLLSLEILTLDKGIWSQIRIPDIRPHKVDSLEKEAEATGLALVIDSLQQVWVLCQDAQGNYFRWALCEVEYLEAAGDAYGWITALPQVFLVPTRYRKKANGDKK